MGPQHPSCVLRLVGARRRDRPVGPAHHRYLHTGSEDGGRKKWQQVVPLVERMDYLSAHSTASRAGRQKLLGLEMPERVSWIRVLLAELQRLNSHLVWLGTRDGPGRQSCSTRSTSATALDVNELIAGFRMFPSRWATARGPAAGSTTPSGILTASRPDRRLRGPADEERDLPAAHARRGALSGRTPWPGPGRAHRAGVGRAAVRKAFPLRTRRSTDVPSAPPASSTTPCACRRCARACLAARRSTRAGKQRRRTRVVPPPNMVYTEMEAA